MRSLYLNGQIVAEHDLAFNALFLNLHILVNNFGLIFRVSLSIIIVVSLI